jgi:hypothetical protein
VGDLRWDDVKDWFDPIENGSAPDLLVADTTVADWEALLTLARSRGWRIAFSYGEGEVPLPKSPDGLFESDPQGRQRYLQIWPDPRIEIIFRPWSPDEIVGDVSLVELQGQERLHVLCEVLRTLGTALGRPVALHAEGGDSHPPILKYDGHEDRVAFLVGPWL